MTYPNATHLSLNLTRAEMACNCGAPMTPALVHNAEKYAPAWQKVRVLYDAPMVINCGHRCQKCNLRVQGAPASTHLLARATDNHGAKNTEGEAIAIAKAALQVPEIRGICVYDNAHGAFCHIDNRDGPRWLAVNGGKLPGDQDARLRRWVAAGKVVR